MRLQVEKKRTMKRMPTDFTLLVLALFMTMVLLGCADMQKGFTAFKDFGAGRTEQVIAHRLNLRQEPSSKATIIGVLEKGDSVRVESEKGSWLKVTTSEGKEGWVYNRYITGYEYAPEIAARAQDVSHTSPQDGGGRQSSVSTPAPAAQVQAIVPSVASAAPATSPSLPAAEAPQEQTATGTTGAGTASMGSSIAEPGVYESPPSTVSEPAGETQEKSPAQEPLFEDEDSKQDGVAAGHEAPAPDSKSEPLFEDETPPARIAASPSQKVDTASDPQAQLTGDRVKGPWGDAKPGTAIQYRIWRNPGSLNFKEIPVLVTEEVIAADDETVVLRCRREWREAGESKADERESRIPRFLPAGKPREDWKAQHGEMIGIEGVRIGDQTLSCEVYSITEEMETENLYGDRVKTSVTKISYLSEAVPGWCVALRFKTGKSEKIKWELLEWKH